MPDTRRNPLNAVFGRYAADATVAAVEPVTPAMLRIRLRTDRPVAFSYAPGQHIRVQLKDPLSVSGILRPAETLRTYTIWELSADRSAIELRVHLYEGEGIGLAWARAARPGDRVVFWWPEGDFHIRDGADFHVFIGEETAAAAFGPMLRALDPSAEVRGVVEGDVPEHDLPLPRERDLHRVHRYGAPAASSQVLLRAAAGLDLPSGAGAAYVAGEARTCQMVRDLLVGERGWQRTAVKVKPFWTPAKRGLH